MTQRLGEVQSIAQSTVSRFESLVSGKQYHAYMLIVSRTARAFTSLSEFITFDFVSNQNPHVSGWLRCGLHDRLHRLCNDGSYLISCDPIAAYLSRTTFYQGEVWLWAKSIFFLDEMAMGI